MSCGCVSIVSRASDGESNVKLACDESSDWLGSSFVSSCPNILSGCFIDTFDIR